MIGRLLRLGLWAISLAAIAAFVALSAVRFVCPIELGNGEGMMLDSAIRLAHGQPLYVEPTLRFIPFVYMPMFPALVAPLVKIFGPELWEGRLVDLLGVFGFVAVLWAIVKRETGSPLLGAAGAALFLMGHGITRGGYDVVRPDPVMLMLAFAGLALLRFRPDTKGAIWAAVLAGLGFFDKQHGLLFGFAGAGYLLFHDRRRLPAYALTLLAVAGGGFLLLTLWLGPWFPFYTYDVPSHWSHINVIRIMNYVSKDVFSTWGVCAVPAVFGLWPAWREGDRRTLLAWFAWGGGLAAGLLATLDPYAYRHTLMPVVVSLSLLAPIALQRAFRAVMNGSVSERAITVLAGALLIVQYPAVSYSAHHYLPLKHVEETRTAFYARLKAIPGPVLMPYHGFYTWEALGTTSMHLLALDDIVRAHRNGFLRHDPQALDRMFDGLRTGPNRPWLVLDLPLERTGDESRPLWESLAPHYRLVDSLGVITEGLRPVAGLRDAPSLIYAPVEADSTKR